MARLSCGIVGLPNVGKSTLFNALTRKAAEASNYPFCTIDPNVGVVAVPDPRLEVLAEISGSKRIIPAAIEFVDIAGLVKGASAGEGLGNKFLSHVRETDAIAHVVRCFGGEDVVHVSGTVDPVRDAEIIHLELILADLQMAENALEKVRRQAKGKNELLPTLQALVRAQGHLEAEQPIRTLELSDEEREALKGYPFLTAKKVLYLANVSEEDLPEMDNEHVRALRKMAEGEGNRVVPICGKLEEELAQFDEAEQKELLAELGLAETTLDRVIHEAYAMLGLITFLTTGEQETRAWTVANGALAPEAAGRIHTDIQRGFIRAEVISFEDMVTYKGRVGAREAGKMRAEGKEYLVKDGDVILFLHK